MRGLLIMCGIIGYIGEENAAEIIIRGLEALEYRGYDSAGISLASKDGFQIRKTVGGPSGLRQKCSDLHGCTGIGHTRWATHGAATEENAHPHTSYGGMFTVVHNGIIENYADLKHGLETEGVKFSSQTDTEVVAHLLEKNYTGDFKGTIINVLKELTGSYALAVMCRDYPDVIVCAKKSSPLFAGISDDCGYISSDVSAIAGDCRRIFRLNDGEIGFLKKDGLKIFDTDGCRIRKSEIKIKSYDKNCDKGGYEHFMLKEIMEQPTAVRRTLEDVTDGKKIQFRNFHLSKNEIKIIKCVQFVACGSAYHAGLTGAYVTEKMFHRTAKACIASEFRYSSPHIDENTLVVIISQSGETADTLAALRIAKEKNAKTVSIVNVENSTIAQESDCVILTKAGKEIAVATTKAYSAQLAVIYSLVIHLSLAAGEIEKNESEKLIAELKSIPDKIERILTGFNPENIVKSILGSRYICYIGRGPDGCSAAEASLKLKEISYIPCEAYAAGELKHGTISLIDEKSLVIALCCCESFKTKTLSNVNEAAARGADVITVSESGSIQIPKTEEIFYPMLEIIPMQLIAYHTAKEKGCDIDKPKNLAKSVTVE